MPITSSQRKNPTKPMKVMPSITSEAGPRAPSQPAKKATTNPSQPIHLATALVFRIAKATIGTTTPQAMTSPT
jgi:hypothetical protein